MEMEHYPGTTADNCVVCLQRQLREAQEERDRAERETRWASQFECSVHGTCDWSMVSTAKTCMATLANGQPCTETLQRGSSPWDAAIERGVKVIAELDRATDMEHTWMFRAEAAEALAEDAIKLLHQYDRHVMGFSICDQYPCSQMKPRLTPAEAQAKEGSND